MNKFNVGDKVIFLHMEEGNNADYDEDRFTVGNVYIVIGDWGINHLTVHDDNDGVAHVRKDQVKLVTEETLQKEENNLFKVGDKVILVKPEIAKAFAAPVLDFPSVGIVESVYSGEDPYVKVKDSDYCWPTAALDLYSEPEAKYTVLEVLEAMDDLGEREYGYTVKELEDHLKNKQDPEWEEFQRLKKKFEG